jgi:NAD+ kinase
MKIGLHGREFPGQSTRIVTRLLDLLKAEGAELHISSKFINLIKPRKQEGYHFKVFEPGANLKNLDLFISVGGDGTLLESVTYVRRSEVPILGINTGRLGFLATTARDELESSLKQFFKGQYQVDSRTVLHLISDWDLFSGFPYALNDFTIMKKDSSSMITVQVFIDGEFLNAYWADGLIVATPTGSSGYSISCGGPLVSPQSGSFIITPVSPHNLTVRPFVVSDSSRLSLVISGRSKKFLVSLDSRVETVDESVKLNLRRGSFRVNLVRFRGQHYFKTLRQKLNWGLDVRN